ncbi:MAG: cell division topological specificity factor MinE [Candidatus Entotheonellia bacterium]
MNAFADVIKKWFGKGSDDADSKNIAKDRLRLVLVHDRSMLPPETLDALRKELIEVVSRYFEVDHATLSMDVQRTREAWALMVNLPLRRVRSAS